MIIKECSNSENVWIRLFTNRRDKYIIKLWAKTHNALIQANGGIDLLNQLNTLLRKQNLRVTPQREAILKVLYDCRGHHLETENIYELLAARSDKRKKIGLATVYRTMELFEKIGLVSRLSMENLPARYELTLQTKLIHHHLICLKCGGVQEIDDKLSEDFKNQIIGETGFEVRNKSMKIYGYCSRCREQVKHRSKNKR